MSTKFELIEKVVCEDKDAKYYGSVLVCYAAANDCINIGKEQEVSHWLDRAAMYRWGLFVCQTSGWYKLPTRRN